MDSALPDTIGNYRIVSKLGQGGMGAVFHAVQGTLERPVALKLLPLELSSNHEYVTRFLREARAVAQLRHDNIVQVYDAGQDSTRYYIAMELVDGADLQSYIEQKGVLTEKEGLALLLQAARGLAAAHAKGLIHRDIKPHNLLMGKDGTLRIVDFGLVMESSSTTQLTATGACLGTPTYMSPEQADGEQADARTDIYSLGVTFFRVFTGQLPFNSNTVMNLLFKHKFEAPPDPRLLKADLSENTRRLLLHMMAKTRDDRPADGAKLVEMIESMQAGKDLPPPPVFVSNMPGGGTSVLQPSQAFSETVIGPGTVSGLGAGRKKAPVALIAAAAGVSLLLLLGAAAYALSSLGKGDDDRVTRADAALQNGQPREAIELLKAALMDRPEDAAVKERLTRAEAMFRADDLLARAAELEASGNLDAAAASYADAAAADTSGKAQAHLERVRALIEKNKALSTQQRDADRDRFNALATEAERSRNFDEAAKNYTQAAALAEEPLRTVFSDKAKECRQQQFLDTASKAEASGDLATAEMQYHKALSVKSDPAIEAKLAMVRARRETAQNAATEPVFNAAMKDAQRALDAGDFSTARKKFNEALALRNDDATAANKIKETDGRELLARGDAYGKQGNKDSAVKTYTEAIQKWPPLGIEATQRIQAVTSGTPLKPPFTDPNANVQAVQDSVAAAIRRVQGMVEQHRDGEAQNELIAALKAHPGNRELLDCKDAFDSMLGTIGVCSELQKITADGKTLATEASGISDESRFEEAREKMDERGRRSATCRDSVRNVFLRDDLSAVRRTLRDARALADDIASDLTSLASFLDERADRAGEGTGFKLPFGGVRIGTGDKRKAERFRAVRDSVRKLADQARAQSK
jgi:hypothetical protein